MSRPLFAGDCFWSLFCYALLSVLSSFAIILTRKRELVPLLKISSLCFVNVSLLCLFLTVSWVGLKCVNVVSLTSVAI